MRKKIFYVSMALFLSFMISGCSSDAPEPEVPVQYDTSGQYVLAENGEAIINSENLLSDYITDDNCRVFYEIFVGSFSDSDGDGTGDLRGIINRMDYLNDGDPNSGLSLGVEGIWLTPVFESVSYHKYDVSDYYRIDPKFGTADDLRELIDICHERNIKLILDLPINHTGTACSWFSEFSEAHKHGDTANKYYSYYNYYKTGNDKPNGSTYRMLAGTDEYYEGNFDSGMPELNFDNPAVFDEMLNVALYWLDFGADGFRFDAAKYIYYGDNKACSEFWDRYSGTLRAEYPDVYIVYEVWDADSVNYPYFSSGSCFDFQVAGAEGQIAQTAKKGNVNIYTAYVEKYLSKLSEYGENALYTPFISNHDMDRSSGYLTVAGGQAQMGANILILGPGSPFIYYGEEIGMKGTRGTSNTDANRRLAMLWDDGDTVTDPVGTDYDRSKQTNGTVSDLIGNGNSLYNYYKRLIMIRNANPEIARGDYSPIEIYGLKLGGFSANWNGSTVAVFHNTSSQNVTVDLSEYTELQFNEIRAAIGEGTAVLDGMTLSIDANTSVVLK